MKEWIRMVLEIAEFAAQPGHEDEFAAAFQEALPLAAATEGFRSARLMRGIESPSTFVALIEWDTREAHTETFRQSDRFEKWRSLVGPHYVGNPRIQHAVDA
jgi:heme-degrading monooxygenase HmoA